jgi:hypothetical protein
MSFSKFSKDVCYRIFAQKPVMVPLKLSNGQEVNGVTQVSSEWTPFLTRYRNDDCQRIIYSLTPEAIAALNEVNERGQTLLYILMRFCKSVEVRKAIMFSAPKEYFDIKTPDGSTPLIGFMFQQAGELKREDYLWIARDLGQPRWYATNNRGESAHYFAISCGHDRVF